MLMRANRKDAAKLFDQIERVLAMILVSSFADCSADGDYERPRNYLAGLILRPDTYEVLYNLGIAFYNLDRLDEARAVLQRAATLKSEQPEDFYRQFCRFGEG